MAKSKKFSAVQSLVCYTHTIIVQGFTGLTTERKVTMRRACDFAGQENTWRLLLFIVMVQLAMAVVKGYLAIMYGLSPVLWEIAYKGSLMKAGNNGTAIAIAECVTQLPKQLVMINSIVDVFYLSVNLMATDSIIIGATISILLNQGIKPHDVQLMRPSRLNIIKQLCKFDNIFNIYWLPVYIHLLLLISGYIISLGSAFMKGHDQCTPNWILPVIGWSLITLNIWSTVYSGLFFLIGKHRLVLDRLRSLAGMLVMLDWRGIGNHMADCVGLSNDAVQMKVMFGADSKQPKHLCLCPKSYVLPIDPNQMYGLPDDFYMVEQSL